MVIASESGDDGLSVSASQAVKFEARVGLQPAFPLKRRDSQAVVWSRTGSAAARRSRVLLYQILDNYPRFYIITMSKPIHFLGSSLRDLHRFPATARREVGYQLERVQHGFEPSDWKPIKVIGKGVREIRVQQEGQYRVIYIANFTDTIYVLHAFRKKMRKISNQDVDVARQRLQQVQEKRKWSR